MPRLLRGIFRKRRELLLLARLVDKHALSRELAAKLMSWKHPGFSAHVGEPISAQDTQALENLAAYLVKNPLSLQRLVYLDGQQAVIYKALKHNPTLGRNFETMHPLEWLARNRARGDRAAEPPGEDRVESEPTRRRRCSASWARLIAKVFHADPLRCRKCGGKLEIVAYLHDQVAIKEILDHLGLSPPEHPKPPPALREVLRVPVDEEGREIEVA
jgi:hypothetical protein